MSKIKTIIQISVIAILIILLIVLVCIASKEQMTVAKIKQEEIANLVNAQNKKENYENLVSTTQISENTTTNVIDNSENTANKNTKINSSTDTINTNTNTNNKNTNTTISKGNTTNSNPTNTTTNKNKNPTNKTGETPYYIKVNIQAQTVTIYEKDKDGYYTVPVKAMVCSTGTYTPKKGTYKIPGRWNWGGLVGNVYGQYVTVITGDILFHSVPYLERNNPGSLKTAEYDKLGTPASAGCVRLTVADAKWIYSNCTNGTQVEFYSSSNPGPLGKPVAQKISNAEGELKNWDPTDPDSKNPWKK